MSDVFVQALASGFEQALRLMEAALADTPERLWETDLWPEQEPTAPAPGGGLLGSAPWFLGYHALSCLDYDLSGELEPWQPPQPFDENVWSLPARVFTQDELLGYVAYCRDRVRYALAGLDDEAAARLLPGAHRYRGTPYAVHIGGIPLHVTEHAAQIRQFLTAAAVPVRPVPGDRHYEEPSR